MHIAELIRKLLAGLLALLLVGLPGCATPPRFHLPNDHLSDLLVTGLPVVAVRYPPESNLEAYAKGRLEGVLKGTGEGFAEGILLPFRGGGSCSGDFCAVAILVLMAAGATVGAVAGGVYGAIKAVPAATADEIEAALQKSLQGLNASQHLTGMLASSSEGNGRLRLLAIPDAVGPAAPGEHPGYPQLAGRMFSAVLELAVTEIHYRVEKQSRKNLDLCLEVHAKATLVSLCGAERRIERAFVCRSPIQSAADWNGGDPQLFANQFEAALQNLAGQILMALHTDLLAGAEPLSKSVFCPGAICLRAPLVSPGKPDPASRQDPVCVLCKGSAQRDTASSG